MLILALDTTTRAGSIALFRDGEIVDVYIGDAARTHGERLPNDVHRLLARNRVRAADIDLFAVAAGPGSFTGLRVGIAAVQGLAFATARSVVAVSALDMLARAGTGNNEPPRIAAWMDAQRAQVFAALYEPTPNASPRPIRPPVAASPDDVLRAWEEELQPSAVRFVGDGAIRYAELIRATLPQADIAPLPPLAPEIARFAHAHVSEAVAPHAIVPIYVRPPDAELARARRSSS
ncbi:MAG TPA: tRNA (adenosine(37)-N6)-threonylcarbamoyltransferase complex dimerization subunit type 1 TsaB [Gemmatimonadaceae bacterium]|nr:tRNA (adenosine(37)-N6)-threonylcarbamoyltransferase complex dimerization subunit type 1 TsaB [Gemmatimonadaceae bacterium]